MLEAAYNDSASVNAEFNLKIKHQLNSALATELDPGGFRHRADYNDESGCVQMFLESRNNQSARVDVRIIEFAERAEGGGFKV